jgi:hypothetical protein
MKIIRIAAFVAGAAVLLSGAPIAQASAPSPSPVVSSMNPEDSDHFMSGVGGYLRAMDGLDRTFKASADQFRTLAKEMTR